MKKLFVSFILSLTIVTGFSQSKLGEVATVSLTTTDLDSSRAVYQKLGFSEIASNSFPFPWVQVSDGSLLITIRKDPTPYMGLTYYTADADKIAGQLEKEGIVFTQKPNSGDPLKRYYIKSPDGFTIVLASNLGGFTQPSGLTMLTMKQADYSLADKYPNKQCGVFGEYCHTVADLATSIAFWKKIGFELKYQTQEPYPHAILSDGLMIIGLHQTNHFNYPAITYFGMNTEQRIEQLKADGAKNFSEFMGKKNQVLTTWEGQHVFVFSLGM